MRKYKNKNKNIILEEASDFVSDDLSTSGGDECRGSENESCNSNDEKNKNSVDLNNLPLITDDISNIDKNKNLLFEMYSDQIGESPNSRIALSLNTFQAMNRLHKFISNSIHTDCDLIVTKRNLSEYLKSNLDFFSINHIMINYT